MIDERTGFPGADGRDCRKSLREDAGGFRQSDVAACEDERPDSRGVQGQALEPAVANALVPRQHDPAFRARKGEPSAVVRSFRQVFCQALYDGTRGGERFSDRIAVKRLVQENR